MNKALHAFVYLFLALAGTALFFEIQLNEKRAELTDRNRMQEEYFVRRCCTYHHARICAARLSRRSFLIGF